MRRRNPVGDHLRSNLGIISRPGIICGPIWGSFAVRGSFAGRDHLRACTDLCACAPVSSPEPQRVKHGGGRGEFSCLWLFAKLKKKKKFSSLEAIEVFLRLMLFFLRDCVKNVPFYSKFVGLKENF